MSVRTTSNPAAGPADEIVHLLSIPPGNLPPVTKRDLEQAWEAAQAGGHSRARVFRFAPASGEPLDLIVDDRDAAAWAEAVDRMADLSTARGISICLRLIGLVELMARAGWTRDWFSLKRDGAEIAPALFAAAALAPLNDAGGFDEAALRALLPGGRRGSDR